MKETNLKLIAIERVALTVLLGFCFISFVWAFGVLNKEVKLVEQCGTVLLNRDFSLEDYDEDNKVCSVTYGSGEKKLVVDYPYDDYLLLDKTEVRAYDLLLSDGSHLYSLDQWPDDEKVESFWRAEQIEHLLPLFNLGLSSAILALGLLIIYYFGQFFTAYEKSWFVGVLFLALIFSVLFPEESVNGVNGLVIMLLYLLDTFFNVLCELLISKQSRYNFLVSILVEITEIIMCLVLMYRFATMAVTLLFWLPIDIVSFISWSKHKDREAQELTVVRKLKGYQEIIIIVLIVVWTFAVGYFISGLDIGTDFYVDKKLETAIIYLDACASAVGIANGLFIFFRLREQWIAWYICTALETLINILSGQYVLLVLKLAYLSNTTYGYLKWSAYIHSHQGI